MQQVLECQRGQCQQQEVQYQGFDKIAESELCLPTRRSSGGILFF